jgi:hypothetical protein
MMMDVNLQSIIPKKNGNLKFFLKKEKEQENVEKKKNLGLMTSYKLSLINHPAYNIQDFQSDNG